MLLKGYFPTLQRRDGKTYCPAVIARSKMLTIKSKRYMKKGLTGCAVLWFLTALIQHESRVRPLAAEVPEAQRFEYGSNEVSYIRWELLGSLDLRLAII